MHCIASNYDMAFPYTLRQPLTGEIKNLQQSTVDYMELMRLHCKENGINILELFEEDDEFKIGSVPGKTFLSSCAPQDWLIHA